MRVSTVLLCITGFLLIGCRPVPHYHPPQAIIPNEWKESSKDVSISHQLLSEKWWELFSDAQLNWFEEYALKNNPTLESALWRIYEARAQLGVAASGLFPHLDFIPSTTNQVQLIKIPEIITPTTTTEQLPIVTIPPYKRFKNTQYNLPFLASYEFDLWNRIGYGVESAYAQLQAQEEAWRATQLILTSSIATAYFKIRLYDTERHVLNQTISVRTEAYEINKIRYDAGLINYSDVSRAETELWLAKVDLSKTLLLRAEQEHLLATLLGDFPSQFEQDYKPLNALPPIAPIYLPSEVVLQRPDLKQAERELASLYADFGATYATLFPSLNISAQIGYSAPVIGELLTWKARFFLLAWEGFQTIFDAGKKTADIEAAKARFKQGLNRYSENIFTAFKEVENALSSLKWDKIILEQLDQAVNVAQTSTDIANERYQRGLVSYLEVIDAERTLLTTQLNRAQSMGDIYLSTIDLIKSLGGSYLQDE